MQGRRCCRAARALATEEGIFTGISGGATLAGALAVAAEAPPGSRILCMLPDTGERWGIIGVGLMPWDRKMYDALTKQDCLYGLLLRGNTSACARVVGSIVDFVFVPEDPEASLKRLCSPSVKIISLTVTEKGYYRTVSGELDVSNALVKEDIDGFGAAGLAQPRYVLTVRERLLLQSARGGGDVSFDRGQQLVEAVELALLTDEAKE